MQKFLGVKIVGATPMTREYAETNHNVVVGGNNHGDGYLVEYDNGYKSWSPKDVFDAAYRPTDFLSFGLAIEAMRQGRMVARKGWNGKGMFLRLVSEWNGAIGEMPPDYTLFPWIGMKTADNGFVPWLASQTDMLADDWQIVEAV